jgi:phage gp45-like
MIRGIVTQVLQGVIQRVSAKVWGDGSVDNRELFQHYGVTSRPIEGAEVIFIRQGGQFIAVAEDDRRYRISLKEGEVALYDDLGQAVHLTREGIVISSGVIKSIGHSVIEGHAQVKTGKSGTFVDKTGKVITVRNGIVVGIDG